MTHGFTLAWELSRASRGRPKPGFWYDAAMSGIRGCGFALGATYLYGAAFGATFGALSTVGQILAYQAGVRPTVDYRPATRPRLTKFQSIAAVIRTVGYTLAAYISALVAWQRANAVSVSVRAGLVSGVVTEIVGACTPFVEWFADRLPQKRMGVFGVGLILSGFVLQSAQYWVALLDVHISYK